MLRLFPELNIHAEFLTSRFNEALMLDAKVAEGAVAEVADALSVGAASAAPPRARTRRKTAGRILYSCGLSPWVC